MDIMLTVIYSLKIPKEVSDQREHLVHYPLIENKNCLKCAPCVRWLHLPGKEYMPVSLAYGRVVKGIPLCPGCAWELEKNMESEESVRNLKGRISEKNRADLDK